jgi:signal transduction histidine kinase
VVRRVWPEAVFGWILGCTCLAAAFDSKLVSGPAALVALYTVAAWRPRKHAVIAAAALEAAAVGIAVEVRGAHWWYATIFLSGLVVAALGLGLYATTRRAYLQELHDRAERLERERDQAHELAVVTERARIIREMHDVVAHNLTVIVALSDGAAGSAARAPERAAQIMRTVSATGRQALANPPPARHPQCRRGSRSASRPRPRGPRCVDRRRAGRRPGRELRDPRRGGQGAHGHAAHRLPARPGSVTNTLKHGGRDTHAAVRLHYLPGQLHIDIEDDGAGALAAAPTAVGRGLTGMAERVHAFGGRVQSGPRTPKGWRVSAQLPLDDRPSA